jgi:hypothetical protein
MISESLTVTGRLTVTVAPRLTHAATRAGSTVTVGRDVAQAQAPSQTPPHWQASVPALAPIHWQSESGTPLTRRPGPADHRTAPGRTHTARSVARVESSRY